MADPIQKGVQLLAKPAPTFEDFVVVDGTWREADPLAVEALKNGNSETINYTGSDPGIDAECEWVIKAGKAPAKKLDEVVATFPGAVPTTKVFIVVEAPTQNFGGKPLRQSVRLEHRESMTYAAGGA